ncbi:ligase-associated DNA damage response endonuclease PdeM [Caldimonas sp. KR1-144]|uniref:ligase-associated DNA damage response endonuclease PdeM n=1 Tax=Caldimonas sp. KR1-144 TaxID=3400911 RepID=UPI003BFD15C6
MRGELVIEVAGERLALLPHKAAWLPAHETLFVADVHVGKARSFRTLGVPVPHGTTSETLCALSALIEDKRARRVVFLGDFLHSAHAHAPATLQALSEWRARHRAVDLTLVRGNHDERAGDPPAGLGIETVDEPFALGALALCHHPRDRLNGYVLAGHEHPCVSIGNGIDRVRLPCFRFDERVGVLPAFGAFTGMHAVRREPQRRLFAVVEGERVIELR